MKKSNLAPLLILLMGILTFVSCSSGDDSPNNSSSSISGGEYEVVSCLAEKDGIKICLQGRVPTAGRECDGEMGTSCPSNPNKTCLFIETIEGKEYDVDFFLYSSSYSSVSCEVWADHLHGTYRVR
jgi:hypothetical protein